jgi:hypothetical protein
MSTFNGEVVSARTTKAKTEGDKLVVTTLHLDVAALRERMTLATNRPPKPTAFSPRSSVQSSSLQQFRVNATADPQRRGIACTE